MASIITGVIIWILTAYIVLSFFGTVIISVMIDEQLDDDDPTALALKAAAIVTTPLSIWSYFYLLKKRATEKQAEKKAIDLERKAKEFVAFLSEEDKKALDFKTEIDEAQFEFDLIKGLTYFGKNNYYGVLVYISVFENEFLDLLASRNFTRIFENNEIKMEMVEEWHYKRHRIKEVFEKYREMIARHYGND